MKLDPSYIESLMQAALEQAENAHQFGEVPVGAVVAKDGEIIARAHNLTETSVTASGHAELLAMQSAAASLGNWRLDGCVLCVTLEPCTMCTGMIKLARVPVVVYGVADPKAGAMGSLYDLSSDLRTGPAPRVIAGIRAAECGEILKAFFAGKRTA